MALRSSPNHAYMSIPLSMMYPLLTWRKVHSAPLLHEFVLKWRHTNWMVSPSWRKGQFDYPIIRICVKSKAPKSPHYLVTITNGNKRAQRFFTFSRAVLRLFDTNVSDPSPSISHYTHTLCTTLVVLRCSGEEYRDPCIDVDADVEGCGCLISINLSRWAWGCRCRGSRGVLYKRSLLNWELLDADDVGIDDIGLMLADEVCAGDASYLWRF